MPPSNITHTEAYHLRAHAIGYIIVDALNLEPHEQQQLLDAVETLLFAYTNPEDSATLGPEEQAFIAAYRRLPRV